MRLNKKRKQINFGTIYLFKTCKGQKIDKKNEQKNAIVRIQREKKDY